MREIRVLPGREVPEIFWYAANLQYALSAQPGPAPLVFIIPGTGANFDASKSVILQLTVDANAVLWAVLFSLVMGAIGGLFPALSAMRQRPLEALR